MNAESAVAPSKVPRYIPSVPFVKVMLALPVPAGGLAGPLTSCPVPPTPLSVKKSQPFMLPGETTIVAPEHMKSENEAKNRTFIAVFSSVF